MAVSLTQLNNMDRARFTAALGAVFEASPWVADGAWPRRPFANRRALHAAMVAAVDEAGADRQLALIAAHPDLAGKVARAGALSADSAREQAGAGLDRLTDAELERFHRLNDGYRARFGFPFVVCARDHTKESILNAFETRLRNERPREIAEALRNIARIAELRLADAVTE
jgi:2-oxo-4-hydroxy-4-carboxy-5-ureidoimidazoline decarboxylase